MLAQFILDNMSPLSDKTIQIIKAIITLLF